MNLNCPTCRKEVWFEQARALRSENHRGRRGPSGEWLGSLCALIPGRVGI